MMTRDNARDGASPAYPLKPIMIFDSGLGGLSVLRCVMDVFPGQDIHYVADDAFFPFGDKEPDFVRARLLDILPGYVKQFDPSVLVLACNTGFLIAGEFLAQALPIPVYGCMPPIAKAVELSRSKLISVIATRNTIAILEKASESAQRSCQMLFVPSDDLAPAVEDFLRGDLSALARAEKELGRCFAERDGRRVDVVVLGCSHYPLLGDRLTEMAPWNVTFIDSAASMFPADVAQRSPGTSRASGQFRLELTTGRAPEPVWNKIVTALQSKSALTP
jgi:glutamate racemase